MLLRIDSDFKQKVEILVETCSMTPSLTLSCFWGAHYFEELDPCSDVSLMGNFGLIYRGPCLVGRFFKEMRERANPGFEYMHKLYNTITPEKRYHFLMFSIVHLCALSTINNNQVPSISENLVKETMRTSVFTISRELTRLDSSWISEIYELAVSRKLYGQPWDCFLRLVNLFTKAIPFIVIPIEPLKIPKQKEELFKTIEEFLKSKNK